jgi:hypothetical protein
MARHEHGVQMQNNLREYLEYKGYTVFRFHDQQSGYSGSVNDGDFLAILQGVVYLIEVKCTTKPTLSFSALTQHQRNCQLATLGDRSKKNQVHGVVVFGYTDRGSKWIPAKEFFRIEREEKKSLRWEDHPEFNFECPAPKNNNAISKAIPSVIKPVQIKPQN